MRSECGESRRCMTHEVNVYAIVVVATVYIPRVDKCTDRFTTDSQILGHELLTLANVSQQVDAQHPLAIDEPVVKSTIDLQPALG